LALIYGVETKRLNESVRRNKARFPIDFMFQLTWEEFENLKSQFVTSNFQRSQIATFEKGKGKYRKYPPYAFTEHGAVMLASVLNSPQAVEASIFVVRAFVKLREFLAGQNELSKRVDDLEEKINELEERHDDKFHQVFEVLRQLIRQENEPREPIGFKRK
jgi:phage regulator Rha-like protein